TARFRVGVAFARRLELGDDLLELLHRLPVSRTEAWQRPMLIGVVVCDLNGPIESELDALQFAELLIERQISECWRKQPQHLELGLGDLIAVVLELRFGPGAF